MSLVRLSTPVTGRTLIAYLFFLFIAAGIRFDLVYILACSRRVAVVAFSTLLLSPTLLPVSLPSSTTVWNTLEAETP